MKREAPTTSADKGSSDCAINDTFFLNYMHGADILLHILLSITNKMQRYTIFFINVNAVHVSGGFSAHHQDFQLTHDSSKKQKNSTNTRCCVYSFELLIMGGGTAQNM